MGFRSFVSGTKRNTHIKILLDECAEYLRFWAELPEDLRDFVSKSFGEGFPTLQREAGNMTAKGKIDYGIQLRYRARKTRDSNLSEGIKLWMHGAWLESKGRDYQELHQLCNLIERAAAYGIQAVYPALADRQKDSNCASQRSIADMNSADRGTETVNGQCQRSLEASAKDTSRPNQSASMTKGTSNRPEQLADEIDTRVCGKLGATRMRRFRQTFSRTPDLYVLGYIIGTYEAVSGMALNKDSTLFHERVSRLLRSMEITATPAAVVSSIKELPDAGADRPKTAFENGRDDGKQAS